MSGALPTRRRGLEGIAAKGGSRWRACALAIVLCGSSARSLAEEDPAGAGRQPGLADALLSPAAGTTAAPVRQPGHGPAALFALTAIGTLAMFLGALVLYRRFFPSRGKAHGEGWVRVVDRASLTPRHTVYIVRVGQRLLALGVSGERLTPLADLGEERGLHVGGSSRVSDRAGTPLDVEGLGPPSAGGEDSGLLDPDRAPAHAGAGPRAMVSGWGAEVWPSGSRRTAP